MTPQAIARRRALAAGACTLACAAVGPALSSPPTAQPVPARQAPASFAPALARALPIAVAVYALGGRPGAGHLLSSASARSVPLADDEPGAQFEDAAERGQVGAGFVIDAAGFIVTAAHVVAGQPRIVVGLADRRVMLAELVGTDADADVALLRVPVALPQPLLGQSTTLRAGDWVLAIGEPYGLSRSVSAGIVGGTARHLADESELLFIQSDVVLNPGNSGGALFDSTGAVVGMNASTVVAGFGSTGVSLSLPIEVVQQIVAELRTPAAAARPRLGAEFEDVPPPVALASGRSHAHGALVGAVAAGGIAARIGLRAGDIVVGMNGRAIGDSADLARVLLVWRLSAETRLVVWRAGSFRHLVWR